MIGILCGYYIRFVPLCYDLLTTELPSQVERTFLDNKCNLNLLTPFERSQDISPNAPTLPMRITLASFHVASRQVFPVIYGTHVLIMSVSEALMLIEIFSLRFTL